MLFFTGEEWQFGYRRRFGMYHVDFETLNRTPKSSALFYGETIKAHGENIQTAYCNEKKDEMLLLRELCSMVPEHTLVSHNANAVGHSQLAMVQM